MRACILAAAISAILFQLFAEETFAFLPSQNGRVLPPPSVKRQVENNNKCKPSALRRQPYNIRKSSSGVGPLQASPLLTAATSPFASIAILAGIVLVHESGHYLAARSFGIEVEEFSVGVGPKLFGFEAFGDTFNLRAIPLGGYVRFPENYNATLVREQEREAFKAAKEYDEQQEKTFMYRVLNALTFGSLDDLRRQQEKERRAKVTEEQSKLPWWKKVGVVKDREDKTTQDILDIEDVEIEYYDDPNLLQNRPWQQRAVVLSAGVIFNLLLSFFIYFGQIGAGPGLPSPVFDRGALVSAEPRPGAAAYGVLHKGDVVVGYNGAPVTLSQSPTAFEAQKGIGDFISAIRSTPDSESVKLSIMHPGDDSKTDVSIQPKRASTEVGEAGPQTIGVLLQPNFVKSDVVRSDSWIQSAGLAAKYVATETKDTASGLLSFIGEVASGNVASSSSQVSGPIGLIKTGSEIVSTQDWTAVLLFAAAISVNLGVINAFPLPALDGGQLVFVLAEALTRRKVDQRLQEGITAAALLFLLLASAGAAFSDIESIFGM